MSKVYGKDFAYVYNKRWAFWGPKMWSFLSEYISKNLPAARSWLDICCGAGSLLRFVCRKGYSATGVDFSKPQLHYARQNAPQARFITQDIRKLSLPQEYDIITCMFDSLNYLTSKQDLLHVFSRVHHHLRRGGLFAFDINTYDGLLNEWCRTSTTHDRGFTLIVETSFNPKKALGLCRITGFMKEGTRFRRFQEDHVERGYRSREIEALLTRAQFSFRKYDGNKLSRPKKLSGRLLYLCKKKQSQ
jgi:SAM-dependent methyltransferase